MFLNHMQSSAAIIMTKFAKKSISLLCTLIVYYTHYTVENNEKSSLLCKKSLAPNLQVIFNEFMYTLVLSR